MYIYGVDFLHVRDAHPDAPWQMHLATVCACALFAFLSAYVAMLVADWVAGKFKR